jgi:glycosyltransferase involved in cell wall biosynthesis
MRSEVSLSVVIPVYNGADYLAETIDSVLHFSEGLRVEIVVIDDGSTDETPEILRSYANRIHLLTQVNSGESSAVNSGLEKALGRFVVVISADDPVFSRELFLGVEEFFGNNPKAVAWFPDWRVIDGAGRVVKINELPEFSFRELFAWNHVLPGPGTWIRREAALKIRGRRVKWKYVGDFDFWLRLSLIGDLVHREGVIAQWRSHAKSTSVALRGLDMANERIAVIDEFVSEFRSEISEDLVSLARANSYYLAAKLGFFSKEVNSRKLFILALRSNPRFFLRAKIHECIFMLFFPVSKALVDLLRILTVQHD